MAEAAKLKALGGYLNAVQKTLSGGYASEGSHYPALKTLLESLRDGIVATSLPSRIECGAPDFIVTKGPATIGYVEAKDIGKSLDEAEKTEQLKRYLPSLSNFILTDYLAFRWYVNGERRLAASLGTLTAESEIKRDKAGIQAVAELLSSFLAHEAEAVGTPEEMAIRMARQAHLIRNLIVNAFEKETEDGSLHSQLAAFRDNLIPDLSVDYFADMYAQTIAYGLFAARCISSNGASFTRLDAAQNLPKTNPFLRKLFQYIAGYDLDDRIAWLVDDLAQVLAQADMEAVLKNFGKRSAREDPVVHFYETFLEQYDDKIREIRGVYYTPEPVVSYIVHSIDHLLKTRFDKPLGLADEKTLILDPALGTATFLYMVINEIHDAVVAQGQKGLWNDYVAEKLLPRVFGFELLMAPYAVAHLKLGLLLQETGYEFKSNQRLGIYLTNTLEEAVKRTDTLFARWITEEANAAAEIKTEKPIMVVLGNPPYRILSANLGQAARALVEPYKYADGIRIKERGALQLEKNLQDDYVKFIRFGQWRIERTGQGILGFITNHGYLDNPTLRGMRQSLMGTFTDIYIVDLHGSTKKGDSVSDDGKDENVFDIQQGVAIALFVKEPTENGPARVYHAHLRGPRGDWPDLQEGTKYHILTGTDISSTDWKELRPCNPFYLFVPMNEELRSEYESGWPINKVMLTHSAGIITARDHLVTEFEPRRESLLSRVAQFRTSPLGDDELCDSLGIAKKKGWHIAHARRLIRSEGDISIHIQPVCFRPFDKRLIFYHRSLVWGMAYPVMRHILAGENLALVSARSNKSAEMDHFFCSRHIVETKCGESTTQSCIFPLYLYASQQEVASGLYRPDERRPNLNREFIQDTQDKLGLQFVEDGRGDFEQTLGPEDIFNYAYAVFHSPTYRTRYAEFLKIDFARLPLTSDKELFRTLAQKGAELVSLHLMEATELELQRIQIKFNVRGSNAVEKVTYDDNSQRVYINKTQYFDGVPPEVWSFQIGGYQVPQKWLKDRKGRTLTYDELTHYQKVIVALKETIRLMAEIDEVIPGWPVE